MQISRSTLTLSGRARGALRAVRGAGPCLSEGATYYVVLDTETPPFDDVDVRRALNFALDRDRIVQIFGGEAAGLPTCQTAPAQFPWLRALLSVHGRTGPGGMGSWTAPPDLEEARGVVRRSGTTGMRVVFE